MGNNNRVVLVCVQQGGVGGGLHVVSCFAPTRASSREVKDAFIFGSLNIP